MFVILYWSRSVLDNSLLTPPPSNASFRYHRIAKIISSCDRLDTRVPSRHTIKISFYSFYRIKALPVWTSYPWNFIRRPRDIRANGGVNHTDNNLSVLINSAALIDYVTIQANAFISHKYGWRVYRAASTTGVGGGRGGGIQLRGRI